MGFQPVNVFMTNAARFVFIRHVVLAAARAFVIGIAALFVLYGIGSISILQSRQSDFFHLTNQLLSVILILGYFFFSLLRQTIFFALIALTPLLWRSPSCTLCHAHCLRVPHAHEPQTRPDRRGKQLHTILYIAIKPIYCGIIVAAANTRRYIALRVVLVVFAIPAALAIPAAPAVLAVLAVLAVPAEPAVLAVLAVPAEPAVPAVLAVPAAHAVQAFLAVPAVQAIPAAQAVMTFIAITTVDESSTIFLGLLHCAITTIPPIVSDIHPISVNSLHHNITPMQIIFCALRQIDMTLGQLNSKLIFFAIFAVSVYLTHTSLKIVN